MLNEKLAINAIESVYVDGMTEEQLLEAASEKVKQEYGSVLSAVLLFILPELVRWFIMLVWRNRKNESESPDGLVEVVDNETPKTRRTKRGGRSTRNR